LGIICAFFTYYTVRLLIVTGALQHTRVGGQGAYIGALVFPLISVICAWAAIRAWKRGGDRNTSL
ncbi:MAG: hypothetical protein ABIT38_23750, partial [Gemmatimonadaceae bacterium]